MKLVGTDALYAEPVPIVLPRLATALYLEAIRTLASATNASGPRLAVSPPGAEESRIGSEASTSGSILPVHAPTHSIANPEEAGFDGCCLTESVSTERA
jgi:hypothetical protein